MEIYYGFVKSVLINYQKTNNGKMDKIVMKKGIKEYRKLFTNKPTKFDIWWYGYEVWKYVQGFLLGVIFIFIFIKILT